MPEVEHKHGHHAVTVEEEMPEVEDFSGEVDEVETSTASKTEKPKKEAPARKRGTLPEGYVTPVGLAKELTERGFGKDKGVLAPQIVYSYIKNAPAESPFPMEEVEDSIGAKRAALRLEAGVEWWTEMRKRVDGRKANAAAKAAAKVKAATKPAEVTEAEEDFTESED